MDTFLDSIPTHTHTDEFPKSTYGQLTYSAVDVDFLSTGENVN